MVLEMNASQVLEHIQINNIILAAAGDGVLNGLAVSERGAGVNMSVDVAAGTAMVGGTAYTEGSTVNLVIEAAHATLHRKDLITYDPTTSNPVVTKGTNHAGGTGDPIYPPDIPAGDILLAIIEVAAAATTITSSEIMDCIVEITKLDELGTPSDSTTLDATTAVHGLLKKLSNVSTEFLNGEGNWATPAGAGDMSKSVYDTDDNGKVDDADKVGGRTVSSGWNGIPINNGVVNTSLVAGSATTASSASAVPWTGITGKPSTFPPSAHNQSATTITSGTLPVARGGTGVTSSSSVADVNATKVDGCSAGTSSYDVYKIPNTAIGRLLVFTSTGLGNISTNGVSGHQLTSQGAGFPPYWAAASDLIFSDTHCPKCGKEFQDGDDLILHVIGHNEVGDILTLPMHLSCANEPKKTVMVQRKVMEDHFILDEDSGELKTTRVQKTTKKTVTRHRLKEGHIIDGVTGKAHTVDDKGTRGEALPHLADALEEIEETIEEPVYEDVEYRL